MDDIVERLLAVERARDAIMHACGTCRTCRRLLSELDDLTRELTRRLYEATPVVLAEIRVCMVCLEGGRCTRCNTTVIVVE